MDFTDCKRVLGKAYKGNGTELEAAFCPRRT